MIPESSQEHVRRLLKQTSHVRLIYNPKTMELLRTIIPENKEELDEHHPPVGAERHADLPVAEYLEHALDDGLPNPQKLMSHVEAKYKA